MAEAKSRSTVEAAVRPINGPRTLTLPWPLNIYQTAIGKKWVMAVTGLIGMAFITGHMVGNLKMYLGAAELDHYAEALRTVGEPFAPRGVVLWIVRSVLSVSLVLHVHAAWSLLLLNGRARPTGYQSKRDYIAADWASRTMKWTGPLVMLFIIFHLLDLTWGVTNPGFEQGAVYDNVVASFERVPVAIAYIVANLALGVHLFHGAWSLFQSLGVNNPQINRARRLFAVVFTVAVIGPNISFPIAVLTGIVG